MAFWNREFLPSRLIDRKLSPLIDFDSMFDRLRRDFYSPDLLGDSFETLGPKVEVQESDKNIKICAELPGMKEKDISVTLRDNTLILEGERKSEKKKEGKGYYRSEFSYGSFYRAIPVNTEVDQDQVEATYRDGILEVNLVKLADSESTSKKIEIKH